MQITQFSSKVQELYHQIQQQVQAKIILQDNGRQEDWLAFDQSGHKRDHTGNIYLEMAQSSNPDFTLAHELRHIQMEMSNFAEISFPITTTKPEFDQQLQATAVSLLGSVEHVLIMQQQRAAGEITNQVKSDFIAGLAQKVEPETPATAQYFVFRILMLLDALTFSEGQDWNHWEKLYPQSWSAASFLYQSMTKRLTASAFAVRRQEVNLLSEFNQLLHKQNYQDLPYTDFVAIAPILSERQLRLTLEQVFKIKHAEFLDRQTNQRAFILIGNNDQQSVGTLNLQQLDPTQYQRLYQINVQDFLKAQQIHYLMRT
ncbi:MAG: hypothetical protein J6573_01430 [Lactobacillus sp.]|nr:hypothetical protein [Lactobacillus sp.]